MGRQPTLTINVNSQQFQNFANQFNAFSGQIRTLNRNFNQINQSLNRSNILVRGVQASMQGLLNTTKSLGSEIGKITKSFISWSTIIGGITALLGMGGGLFGIERLAASILAKRRQVLGLGGDYGRTQANMVFSQSLLSSPGRTLQNIRLGMGGDPEYMTGLLSLGVPFGTKKDPNEVMDQVIKRAMEIMRTAPKGQELMVAKAYQLDKFFDPMDLLRMTTEEGRKEIQMRQELIAQYKDQMEITPKALRAWTELELQLKAAGATIQSALGEKLADLAGPLKHLSEGFTQFVRTLMDTPQVKEIIKHLADGIEWLAEKLKTITKEDINDFIEKVKSWIPSMDDFKTKLHDFVEILGAANTVLEWLKPLAEGLKAKAESTTMADAAQAGGAGWIYRNISKPVEDWAYRHATPTMRGYFQGPFANAPTTTSGAAAGGLPTVAPFNTYGGQAGGFAGFSPSGGGGNVGGKFGGFPGLGGFGGGMTNWWSGVANQFTPQKSGDGGGFGTPPVPSGSFKQGALDSNNWQMSRVAQLTVRNVPGSNMFMTANGMTG